MNPPETNRSAPPPSLPHDAACKSTFAHALAVEDLMHGFVASVLEHDPARFATLDFDTLEPVSAASIDNTWHGPTGFASMAMSTLHRCAPMRGDPARSSRLTSPSGPTP